MNAVSFYPGQALRSPFDQRMRILPPPSATKCFSTRDTQWLAQKALSWRRRRWGCSRRCRPSNFHISTRHARKDAASPTVVSIQRGMPGCAQAGGDRYRHKPSTSIRSIIIQVRAPFPGLAGHVMKAVAVHCIVTHRKGAGAVVEVRRKFIRLFMRRIISRPPRVLCFTIAAASSVFPLCIRRQTPPGDRGIHRPIHQTDRVDARPCPLVLRPAEKLAAMPGHTRHGMTGQASILEDEGPALPLVSELKKFRRSTTFQKFV